MLSSCGVGVNPDGRRAVTTPLLIEPALLQPVAMALERLRVS